MLHSHLVRFSAILAISWISVHHEPLLYAQQYSLAQPSPGSVTWSQQQVDEMVRYLDTKMKLTVMQRLNDQPRFQLKAQLALSNDQARQLEKIQQQIPGIYEKLEADHGSWYPLEESYLQDLEDHAAPLLQQAQALLTPSQWEAIKLRADQLIVEDLSETRGLAHSVALAAVTGLPRELLQAYDRQYEAVWNRVVKEQEKGLPKLEAIVKAGVPESDWLKVRGAMGLGPSKSTIVHFLRNRQFAELSAIKAQKDPAVLPEENRIGKDDQEPIDLVLHISQVSAANNLMATLENQRLSELLDWTKEQQERIAELPDLDLGDWPDGRYGMKRTRSFFSATPPRIVLSLERVQRFKSAERYQHRADEIIETLLEISDDQQQPYIALWYYRVVYNYLLNTCRLMSPDEAMAVAFHWDRAQQEAFAEACEKATALSKQQTQQAIDTCWKAFAEETFPKAHQPTFLQMIRRDHWQVR